MGPDTGIAGDAELRRRWPVRLTDVETRNDDGTLLVDPLKPSQALTQIRWAHDDALPFPLCVSSRAHEQHGQAYYSNVSVARGNIVLVDHGQTFEGEPLAQVPATRNGAVTAACNPCNAQPLSILPSRYRPLLARRPLTQVSALAATPLLDVSATIADMADLDNGKFPSGLKNGFDNMGIDTTRLKEVQGTHPLWSVGNGVNGFLIKHEQAHLNVYRLPPAASAMILQDPRQALPAIHLNSTLKLDNFEWTVRQDLLDSTPLDRDFVVETESDGGAWLRFGDGQQLGRRPESATQFMATYRVGNGTAGNVGAEAIAHLVYNRLDPAALTLSQAVSDIRNPLPATGGIEPESLDQVRAYAPAAFRTQERAVTEADYAAVTERHPQVQKAVATFRWTGSWRTVFITVDRLGGLPVDAAFKAEIGDFVERFRMAGYDLEVDAPRFVSLEIDMHVCVKEGYFREDVKAALLKIFSANMLPDGRRGVFHPDNFTFGQSVYLSPLIAAAQAVDGVQSLAVTTFQRQGTPDPQLLAAKKLDLGRLEIARCENDPNFVEHGLFTLTLGGGK